jgi:hypothetical protein
MTPGFVAELAVLFGAESGTRVQFIAHQVCEPIRLAKLDLPSLTEQTG